DRCIPPRALTRPWHVAAQAWSALACRSTDRASSQYRTGVRAAGRWGHVDVDASRARWRAPPLVSTVPRGDTTRRDKRTRVRMGHVSAAAVIASIAVAIAAAPKMPASCHVETWIVRATAERNAGKRTSRIDT